MNVFFFFFNICWISIVLEKPMIGECDYWRGGAVTPQIVIWAEARRYPFDIGSILLLYAS